MREHHWNPSPKEAVALQRKLASEIRVAPLAGTAKTIAGADCAFLDDGRKIVAAAILCDAETMDVVSEATDVRPCTFPYVPGLLSFREAPAVIAAVKKLPHRPDVLMCDGQGRAHPRGLGLACHVGLLLDLPTIGVAKSRLCGEHADVDPHRGARTPLKFNGDLVGAVVRTRDNVRPLYLSVGHRITLDEAVAMVLACGRGRRLPEPTRLADRRVAALKRGGSLA